MEKKDVPYSYAGTSLGKFSAEVCTHCRETYFTEDGWKAIERAAKARGVWGTARQVKVGQSGHSLILRIPASLAAAAHLKRGSMVYIELAGRGKILVERRPDE